MPATNTAPKSVSFRPTKLADLATAIGPKWRKLWDYVKAETETTMRKPGTIVLMTEAREVYLNDGECCHRFAWDLVTGEVGGSRNVSSGEWAVHASSNNDEAITDVPRNAAAVTVVWHEYYRYMRIELQVHPDALPAQIGGTT